MSDDIDYLYWKDALKQHPVIFSTVSAFKHELSIFRDEWRMSGVILERGTGELRKQVLISPSRYIEFLRQQTRRRVA